MKRIHILILFLILLWAAVWLLDMRNTAPLIPPTENITPPVSWTTWTNVLSSWDVVWTSGELLTGAQQTWSVDDTELPLERTVDDGTGVQEEQTDPEVEEIINLLQELIEEWEEAN